MVVRSNRCGENWIFNFFCLRISISLIPDRKLIIIEAELLVALNNMLQTSSCICIICCG